jgi:hypothetical protein
MSLKTAAGTATVAQVCKVFGLSRTAYYEASSRSLLKFEAATR